MTTAAEALVRDCANRLDQLFRQDYTMGEVEAELRRLLRAALATPQAGEVEECIRLLQAYLPVRTLGEEAQHGGLPETLRMAIRLLRATQSNAPAPSAPAQKPRAHGPVSERFMRHHYGASGYHSTNAEGPEELGPRPAPGLHFDARGVLVPDAAPPQDEAVALLREAYNELIVDPEQDEATRAVGDALVERIRAYLKDRT